MRISDWSSDVCSSDLLQSQITTYGVTPTPTNEPEIRQSIKALDEFAAGKSEALVKSTHDLGVLIDQLLGDKGDLVHMYREFLSRQTGEQLQAVDQPSRIGSAQCRERECQYV